jgi:1-acyl-sn-glycerol-3-phosphate acyltransferase
MTRLRKAFRRLVLFLLRVILRSGAHVEIRGRENIPARGPLIVAINHTSHVDIVVMAASLPYPVEFIALADLLSVPVTRLVLHAYGVIPVHRDQIDRNVLRRALDVLEAGGVLALAPEARMSASGALERARPGVGYLALRSGAPVMPVGITGTDRILRDLKQLHRPQMTVTFGPPSTLSEEIGAIKNRRAQRQAAADEIMVRIARILPPDYRGEYAERA